MLKKLLLTAVLATMAYTAATAAPGVRFQVIPGDAEKPYNKMKDTQLEGIGFVVSDPHARINDGYATKYGGTNLDNLGFFYIANDKALRELLIKEPTLGGFSPFNFHIYKLKKENVTRVGHILPETMLDIVGVKDASVRKAFIDSFKPLDKLTVDTLGGKTELVGSNKIAKPSMMKFEKTFTRGEDLSEFVDEFQEKFEGKFEEMKYIIAGYKNFKEAYTDLELPFEKYDAYWVYSLCHFQFSEGVFNRNDKGTVDGRPDSGVFAPCSMYMYIEKGSNVLKIGMPTMQNWIEVMQIKNADKVKAIQKIDKEIVQIMNGLGAKSI